MLDDDTKIDENFQQNELRVVWKNKLFENALTFFYSNGFLYFHLDHHHHHYLDHHHFFSLNFCVPIGSSTFLDNDNDIDDDNGKTINWKTKMITE